MPAIGRTSRHSRHAPPATSAKGANTASGATLGRTFAAHPAARGRTLRVIREPDFLLDPAPVAPLLHHPAPLDARESDVLAKLLTYGTRPAGDPEGALRLVLPRFGTVSPWSSKATDIARNCGLVVHRIERVIAPIGANVLRFVRFQVLAICKCDALHPSPH